MNKKLTIASAILAASAAFAFDTWLGDAPQVETGIGNDTNTYGYWFSYGDDGDGCFGHRRKCHACHCAGIGDDCDGIPELVRTGGRVRK